MIYATNFKTNHTRASTKEYMDELVRFVKSSGIKENIYVFPPSTALNSFDLPSNITLGAQNAYPVEKGSFTGEIGLEQLDEFDIKTILIGHSERRMILGESQEFVAKKFEFFKNLGFKIIYCVGESKEIRDENNTMQYLWSEFDGIDIEYENLIVAYEPIWAIGTGVSAKKEDIDEVLSALRIKIKAPLLYGGSVKSSNIKEIASIKDCDGVLIGSASWDIKSFCEIIKNG
jgi:triosephosphate isomerase